MHPSVTTTDVVPLARSTAMNLISLLIIRACDTRADVIEDLGWGYVDDVVFNAADPVYMNWCQQHFTYVQLRPFPPCSTKCGVRWHRRTLLATGQIWAMVIRLHLAYYCNMRAVDNDCIVISSLPSDNTARILISGTPSASDLSR